MPRGIGLFVALALALGAVVPLVAAAPVRGVTADLFFSEYVEGSGNNKALEIFNGTGAAVDVLAGGYNVQMFFNGSATAGLTVNLDGTSSDLVADGDVFVLAHSLSDLAGITGQADQLGGGGWFNGDDALVLRRGTVVLDVVGQVGFDPGTEWGTGLGSTADNTLRRLECVMSGDPNGGDAFDPSLEWEGFAQNDVAGLGSHALATDPCVPPTTDPTGAGAADPASVAPGETTNLSVDVTPGTNPDSSGLAVTADLSEIGGSASQPFTQGPATNHFTFTATVADGTPPDVYDIPVTITDAQERVGTTTITLAVQDDATEIWEIQGASHLSPLDGRNVFDVEGIVTVVRSNGFWMTDPTPDAADATSDGIFVFRGSESKPLVGDHVTVDGEVDEFRPGGSGGLLNLTITQLRSFTPYETLATGIEPPATVIGVDRLPPTSVIDDDSTDSVEAGNAVFDPESDGIDFWESLEGMRLEVADAVAVGPTNGFREIAVVSQLQTAAGLRTPRGGILVRKLADAGNYRHGDFNPERLILDDVLANTPDVNAGDEFASDPVGVLDYAFGNFKLLVTANPGRADNGLVREVTAPAGSHDLAVATFNVENLSALDGDAKVNQLAAQIVDNLRSPDLVAIEEMQDNNGPADTGVAAADLSWQRLIAAIVAEGGPLYDYRQIDPQNNADGGQPGGNIRVGFLFHSERGLEFVDRPGGDAVTDTDVVATPNRKGARLTVSPGRILDAELGGNKAFVNTRKSLAGEFRFRGETIFVVANHFSSKGDDRPLFGHFQPPFRLTEFESGTPAEDGWRHAQAQAINDFVDEIRAVDDDAHVVVLGDINDFDFSETVEILTGERVALDPGPFMPDADGSGQTALTGDDPVMGTLFALLAPEERYSYVFDGNSQVLDQILVSTSLLELNPTYDVVHVNAEFFAQASDHDPSVMRVSFQPRRGR